MSSPVTAVSPAPRLPHRLRQLEDLESTLMARMFHNARAIADIHHALGADPDPALDLDALADAAENLAHHAERLARLDRTLGAVRGALGLPPHPLEETV